MPDPKRRWRSAILSYLMIGLIAGCLTLKLWWSPDDWAAAIPFSVAMFLLSFAFDWPSMLPLMYFLRDF